MSMRFNRAKIVSHPRAGSHYFAKLLNENFFHRKSYLDLYAGHSHSHTTHLRAASTAVFYIYRNNQDTIKSIYKLRDRFGLKADSLEEFVSSYLSDMDDKKIKSEAIYNSGNKKKVITEVDHYLGTHVLTIDSYLDMHKEFWFNLERYNYMIISYDSLMLDFQNTMEHIAKFLGSEKHTFTNELERIGWYDKKDTKKIFT